MPAERSSASSSAERIACTFATTSPALLWPGSPSSASPMLRAEAVRSSIWDEAADSLRSSTASGGAGLEAMAAS